MLLETIVNIPSRNSMRHIKIKKLFVKDRMNAGEMAIEHCATEDMCGDFFTKPLHGRKFRRSWDVILGK